MIRTAWAVFAKDVRTELRARYALSATFVFALATLAIVSYAVGPFGGQHAIECGEPLLRFLRVDVGNVVHTNLFILSPKRAAGGTRIVCCAAAATNGERLLFTPGQQPYTRSAGEAADPTIAVRTAPGTR